MVIRSQTLRLGIFVSTFVIAAIVIFQLVWLRKIYFYEQKQFNHAIAKAIRGFYEDIHEPAQVSSNLNQLITSPNDATFLARVERVDIHPDSLQVFLQSELEDEDIFTDCYVAVYNASLRQITQTFYLPSATAAKKEAIKLALFPTPYNHLQLYFPHRRQYVLSRINIWIITCAILLVVLILLGGSLYYLYRQKFLNEVQKDFVNNFTHEFKTPVSVINLAAEVLTNPANLQKPEKLATYAAIVQHQGMYLQDQIERLLQHAYAETNALHLQKENVDLHALVEEALGNLTSLIAAKNAVIERSFHAVDPMIRADRGYLLIVITNLVENALKYATQPRIIISTAGNGRRLLLSVKDNGRGIEKKHRVRIFKKFYRVPDGEQVSARGFGLGLAFVRRIVQAHHGRINVESVAGVGSDFRITLPVD